MTVYGSFNYLCVNVDLMSKTARGYCSIENVLRRSVSVKTLRYEALTSCFLFKTPMLHFIAAIFKSIDLLNLDMEVLQSKKTRKKENDMPDAVLQSFTQNGSPSRTRERFTAISVLLNLTKVSRFVSFL